jgi:hypothetical protein
MEEGRASVPQQLGGRSREVLPLELDRLVEREEPADGRIARRRDGRTHQRSGDNDSSDLHAPTQ